jgi:hypothetical protein
MLALGLLFTTSLLGTLLVVLPQRAEDTRVEAESAALVSTVEVSRAVPDAAPPSAPPAATESTLSHTPEELAAAYAEPALIDLLEDAASPDPGVRAEADEVLRAQELLPGVQ